MAVTVLVLINVVVYGFLVYRFLVRVRLARGGPHSGNGGDRGVIG